ARAEAAWLVAAAAPPWAAEAAEQPCGVLAAEAVKAPHCPHPPEWSGSCHTQGTSGGGPRIPRGPEAACHIDDSQTRWAWSTSPTASWVVRVRTFHDQSDCP